MIIQITTCLPVPVFQGNFYPDNLVLLQYQQRKINNHLRKLFLFCTNTFLKRKRTLCFKRIRGSVWFLSGSSRIYTDPFSHSKCFHSLRLTADYQMFYSEKGEHELVSVHEKQPLLPPSPHHSIPGEEVKDHSVFLIAHLHT